MVNNKNQKWRFFIRYAGESEQRMTQALRDVRYRIVAVIKPQPTPLGTIEQLYSQALRRIRSGKKHFIVHHC